MNRYSVRYYVRKDSPTWEITKLHPKTQTGPMNLVSDHYANNKMLHIFLEEEDELCAIEKAMHAFRRHLNKQWRKDFGQI